MVDTENPQQSGPLEPGYEAEFHIAEIPIRVYVLTTGQRVVSLDSLSALLAKLGVSDDPAVQSSLTEFARWVTRLPERRTE